MKIWYLSAYDQPNGASSRTFDYAQEFVKQGCEVTAFTNNFCHYLKKDVRQIQGLHLVEKNDGVEVVWLQNIAYHNNGIKRWINMLINSLLTIIIGIKLAFKSKPEIIIAPSVPLLLALAGWFLALILRVKFVFEVRDIWPQTLVDIKVISKESLLYKILRLIEVFLYKKASLISVVLAGTKAHIAKSGISTDKVCWHPNAKPISAIIPYQPPPERDNYIVTYVGGMASDHDIENIINAAEILQIQEKLEIQFDIYGDGIKRSIYEMLAKEKKLKNLNFYGAIIKAKVNDVLSNANLLISCTPDVPLFQFGVNSNKLVDYFMVGRPVIFCGNAPKNPVELSGGGLSLTASDPMALADAVLHMQKMPKEDIENMSKLNQKYLREQLNISVIAKKYLNALSELE